MKILAPIDGSDCSFRALEFATRFVRMYDAELRVVHVTDHRTEATEELIDRARDLLEREGFEEDVDVYIDVRKFRRANRVGEDVLYITEEEGFDHVVMGHHGQGAVSDAILGSAAKTVLEGTDVPVTVIP